MIVKITFISVCACVPGGYVLYVKSKIIFCGILLHNLSYVNPQKCPDRKVKMSEEFAESVDPFHP